jgi:hypothetical protein
MHQLMINPVAFHAFNTKVSWLKWSKGIGSIFFLHKLLKLFAGMYEYCTRVAGMYEYCTRVAGTFHPCSITTTKLCTRETSKWKINFSNKKFSVFFHNFKVLIEFNLSIRGTTTCTTPFFNSFAVRKLAGCSNVSPRRFLKNCEI